jgi:tetratricopeptide (TPR) repeat protein
LEWNASEKCTRFLKWAEALAAVSSCSALSGYLKASKLDRRVEKQGQALATPTFGTYLAVMQLFNENVYRGVPKDVVKFIRYRYDSRQYPDLGVAVETLKSSFSMTSNFPRDTTSLNLFEILVFVRNRGSGHGGLPGSTEAEAIQTVCRALESGFESTTSIKLLIVSETKTSADRAGEFVERGVIYEGETEHPWERQKASEDLLSVKQLHIFDDDGIPVPFPPVLQVDRHSLWFLQKYRRGGGSTFSDFQGVAPKNDSYWDQYLRTFFEERFERAGKGTIQLSFTGVYHNLPPESDSYTKFVGRETDLGNLASSLSPQRQTHIVALGGVGGVGKTALARSFVQSTSVAGDSDRNFDYVVWISAKTSVLKEEVETLDPGFEDIEDVLDEIARVADSPELIYFRPFESKKSLVWNLLSGGRFLLVIDNFETVKRKETFWRFLLDIPAPSKVLVTSRETFSEGCLTLQIVELTREEALEVFTNECRNLGIDSRAFLRSPKDTEELLNKTGGVPLALKHIAILLERGKSFTEALQRLGAKEGPIADFCFRETFKSLEQPEREVWAALGIFQRPVVVGELVQVSAIPIVDLLPILNTLRKYSIVNMVADEDGNDVFSCLPLTMGFARKEAEKWPPAAEILHRYKQYRALMSRAGISEKSSEVGRAIQSSGAVHPKLVARELARRAMSLYRAGEDVSALELIESAVKLDSSERGVWEVKAEIEMGEFQYETAMDSYLKVLTLAPYDINALRQLVYIAKRLEEWDLAIQYGRQVTQLPLAIKKDWHILGSMYYKKARVEKERGNQSKKEEALLEAIDCLKVAFYQTPSNYSEKKHNTFVCDTLARTFNHLRRFDEAEEVIVKGLEWDPYNQMLLEIQQTMFDRPRY